MYPVVVDGPIIQVENLTKVFGRGTQQKRAVDGINLQVTGQQVFGFLGPNGAGKTTTIRMLLNLIHPTAGQATIFGQDPRGNPAILRQVGTLVEGAAFYPYLTGWDNLRVAGCSQGGLDEERARRLIDLVGLAEVAMVRVGKYSTGMRQRLGLAAALLQDPDLIILDEPTNGMDPAGIREMRTFIRDLAHRYGKTVFLSSHLLGEVQQICDAVAIIHQGRILREGTIAELLDQKPQLEIESTPVNRTLELLQERWAAQQTADGKVIVDAPRDEAPAILRHLIEHNVEVFQVVQRRQTLEDFFFTLTGSPQLRNLEGWQA
ncbi:MAG: ABC transporter ATP-binding protein [Chloroflexi bacterium]|nr:ABC transporter ATP-binding protein [Chloroflexota bacterium]